VELPLFICRCTACELLFGVDQREEDQSAMGCPTCKSDEHMEDVGHGTMTVETEVEAG